MRGDWHAGQAGRAGEPMSRHRSSAGNSAVGGTYTDGSGHIQVFVIVERNGAWGSARQVPGSGALNVGGNAAANTVSCPSAGNCAAGGFYPDQSDNQQGFVVNRT